MERKIGEIFEYNGEWYQCVESDCCEECSLFTTECADGKSNIAFAIFGICSKARRHDNRHAIFKKLEKVGEPYVADSKCCQQYKCYTTPLHNRDIIYTFSDNIVVLEIKNKKDMEEKKFNLKPFDLEAAKQGKPVCTRDGRKARIICFDRKFVADDYNCPILALIDDGEDEYVYSYTDDGLISKNEESDLDLMMLLEKKEGWVNVYRGQVYNTPEKAE